MTSTAVGQGRHSSSWAIHTALSLRGFEPPSEVMLFGLGGSAWYRYGTPAENPAPVLSGVHPDRIKNGFYAMNIWAVRFRYLSAHAEEQVRERAEKGLQTLICIDANRLRGNASPAAEADYTLLVTGVESSTPGSAFLVRGPADKDATTISAEDLRNAWFIGDRDEQVATFYWHPVTNLHWSPDNAVRRALRRFVHQMQYSHPSLGDTGLRGLDVFSRRVRQGDTASIKATAQAAHQDGGEHLFRNLVAEFIRLAASQLRVTALEPVAACFERAAQLWRNLLADFQSQQMNTRHLCLGLDEVLRSEREGIDRLALLAQSGQI